MCNWTGYGQRVCVPPGVGASGVAGRDSGFARIRAERASFSSASWSANNPGVLHSWDASVGWMRAKSTAKLDSPEIAFGRDSFQS